jgi:protein SCO1
MKFFTHKILLLSFIINLVSCKTNDNKISDHILPFIGNPDIEYRMIDGKEVADTVYPKMVDFTFTNQDSVTIHSKNYKGKIWVADFFFTSCPTICPKMTKQMIRLNTNLKDLENEIQFLSFSINPTTDQPHILKAYKKHHHINVKNWEFLTGDLEYTNDLGINHFLLFGHEDPESEGGYAHSPSFSLVDREGYIRGVYNGTEPAEVDRLEQDIRKLLAYEYSVTGSK